MTLGPIPQNSGSWPVFDPIALDWEGLEAKFSGPAHLYGT